MSTVGERIKSIRQSFGLSMSEFGQLFNPLASKGVVSKWENGRYLPNNTRLKRIAELGHISVDELISKPQTKNYSVGKRIFHIRQSRKMTQKEFGILLGGVDRSLISKWEQGENLPNRERIELIAEQGNTTFESLMGYEKLSNNSNTHLVGQRIKDIRSSLNLDQRIFSSKIGSTVSALSNWENGRNKPNDIMLRRIAKLGNVTTEQLLYGNPLSQYSTKELLEELLRREEVVR